MAQVRTDAMTESRAPEGGGRARPWVRRTIDRLLIIIVTWVLYRAIGFDLSTLRETDLREWSPALLPLMTSSVLLIGVYLIHATLWGRITSDLIGKEIPLGVGYRIYFLANLGRYIPGRIWQVAGMALLSERAGFPAAGAITASAIAQLGFLSAGTIFLALLSPSLLGPKVAFGAGALLIAGLAALAWGARSEIGRRAAKRIGGRIGEGIMIALDGVAALRGREALTWIVGYLISWLVMGAAFAIFTTAFVPTASSELRYLAATMAAGYLGGYLAIVAPAGVGVREGVLGLLLATVVPAPAAVVVSLASRVWFTVTEVIVLGALPFLGAGKDSKESDGTEPKSARE